MLVEKINKKLKIESMWDSIKCWREKSGREEGQETSARRELTIVDRVAKEAFLDKLIIK